MKFTVAVLLAGFSILSAQQPPVAVNRHDPAKRFRKLDKDGDGRLSLSEFQAKGKDPARREKRFHKLDANRDNFLTLDELSARKSAKS